MRQPVHSTVFSLALLLACLQAQAQTPSASSSASAAATTTTTSAAAPAAAPALIKTDIKVGKGAEAQPGHFVDVQYTGWLYDANAMRFHGKRFDSSVGRGPFTFRLGGGNVIQGWEQGVVGMKVGGKRTLIIPPHLGYGSTGSGTGSIPPNATLVFDVELLGVK